MQRANSFAYFATIGSADPCDLRAQPLTDAWSEQTSLQPSAAWMDAIVDIAVVQPGEQLPDDTWQLMGTSLDGLDLLQSSSFTPLIAVQRRSGNYRLDHIIDIKVAHSDAIMPEGYEVVGKSITGAHSSRLGCGLGYVLYKRANTSPRVFLEGACMITDLCVVLRSHGESIPDNFFALDRLRGPAYENDIANGATQHEDVVLSLYEQAPVGICDLGYAASTLDRYPASDHPQCPLPAKELPLFAFPHDMRLKLSYQGKFPVPIYFSFVFTDINGDHQYVACLRFYEALPSSAAAALLRAVIGERHNGALEDIGRLGATIYCPKAICVLSRYPFYRPMRAFLRQLFSLSLSALPCPLEYFISSAVSCVPAPLPGGRTLLLCQDLALIGSASKPMAALRFEVPEKRSFPHMDLDFAGPLRCLTVEKLLVVFSLMLREAKIVFVCSSHAILTETMETLRALLFPLTWSSCFVSRLPLCLSGMLGALGGFMIGLQLPEAVSCDHDYDEYLDYSLVSGDDELEEEQAGSRSAHIAQVIDNKSRQRRVWLRQLQRGTYIVDLSANAVSEFNGTVEVPMSPKRLADAMKLLPLGPRRRLEVALLRICQAHTVHPHMYPLSHFDSAVEGPRDGAEFPAAEVRDAFAVFMADCLGDFAKYVVPPSSSLSELGYRTFQESFRVADYIAAADSSMRLFTEVVVQTQMLSALLQRRFDGSDAHLDFFEKAALVMHKCRLTAGGHGAKIPQFSSFPIPEMPAPLSTLVAAYEAYSSTLRHRAAVVPASASSPPMSAPSPAGSSSFSPTNWGKSHENVDLITAILAHIKPSSSSSSSAQQPKECREEIELPADQLGLQDASRGALVLPGPVSRELPIGSGPLGGKRDADGRFCYESWPMLSPELLAHSAESCVHPRIEDIRAASLDATRAAAGGFSLLVRPRSRRLDYAWRLPHSAEESLMQPETYCMFCAFVDIASSLLLLLQARVLTRAKPLSDLLQMTGVISQLEDRNIINHIDEDIIRGIFVSSQAACSSGGGDFVRKIAISMMESTVSRESVDLGSLTVGQYTLALQQPRSLGSPGGVAVGVAPTVSEVDTFSYLETIGLAWFEQRAPQFKSSKQLQLGVGQESTPAKSAMFSSMFSSNTKVKSASHRRSVVKATGATRVVASKLGLVKASGMMSLVAPSRQLHFHNPLRCCDFSGEDDFAGAITRTAQRYGSIVAAHTDVWESELERYTQSRLTESARPSTAAGRGGGDVASSSSPLKDSMVGLGAYLSRQVLAPAADAAGGATTLLPSFGRDSIAPGDERGSAKGDGDGGARDVEEAVLEELQIRSVIQAAAEARARASGSIVTICSSAMCVGCGLVLTDEEVFALWYGFPCLRDGSYAAPAAAGGDELHCPHCRLAITPRLVINEHSASQHSTAPIEVEYLSPYRLRCSEEQLLESHGARALEPSFLCELNPGLYWTVVWYSHRTNIPTGFRAPSPGTIFGAPVIVGWRQAVVCRQAQAVLSQAPGEPAPLPKLKDVLADVSTEKVEEVYRALESIDESMVPLIMALSAPSGSVDTDGDTPSAVARRLYVDVVACVHLFDRLCPPVDGQLGKSMRVDKEYHRAVLQQMTPEHFAAVGAGRQELLAACSSDAAQAFRLGLGFLF